MGILYRGALTINSRRLGMPRKSPKHAKAPELIAVGTTIRSLRSGKSLSQEELALKANIDRAYVGGVERGEHNITLMNLIKLSDAIEISLSDLFKQAKL